MYGLPLPVSTSLRSKITWSFEVCRATPRSARAPRTAGVARERVRIVVVVGEDRLHVQLAREGDDLVGADAVAHEQAHAGAPCSAPSAGQVGGERIDALRR